MEMDPSPSHPSDERWMRRAIELAVQGEGYVEPNPMVGCVIVRNEVCIGEGYHQRFGGPHAEVMAIGDLSSVDLQDATLYVTLEPCSHFGKTPPCVDLLLERRPARVVIGLSDPFPEVSGRGIDRLRGAGIPVTLGVLRTEVEAMNAPYLKRIQTGLPWLIAKWAMSLDGKIASRTGASQWISSVKSREIVHRLRGRVDAILVGIQTVLSDDPLLTARPSGPRTPMRVVFDSRARLPLNSRLVQSVDQGPVLVVCGPEASASQVRELTQAGCQVLVADETDRNRRLDTGLKHLAELQCTNVLIEGGGQLLGSLFDSGRVDEVHTFIAPMVIGGHDAKGPVLGNGVAQLAEAVALDPVAIERVDRDLYLRGRVRTNDDRLREET